MQKTRLLFPLPIVANNEIRVIAPSSFLPIQDARVVRAKRRLESLGFVVTFGENYKKRRAPDWFDSSPVSERIDDFHSAFADPSVKAIIPVCGGYNSIELLEKLDYDLIRKNPKIFCGFSDNTVLSNAIFFKTGLITFHGPNLFYFGFRNEALSEKLISYFFCAFENNVEITTTGDWMDYGDEDNKSAMIYPPSLPYIINEGVGEGLSVGGNLSSLVLLNGTSFRPSFTDIILFLEDDHIYKDKSTFYFEFERKLTSLTMQGFAGNIKGILIGKFEQKSNMSYDDIKILIENNLRFKHIPVVANLDIGHTYPFRTLPIGAQIKINANRGNLSVKVLFGG